MHACVDCRPDGLVDTNLVYPILVQSNLPREVLRHLWTLCNLTFPGQLTRIELYVLLALIGIAQVGHRLSGLFECCKKLS